MQAFNGGKHDLTNKIQTSSPQPRHLPIVKINSCSE